MPYDILKKKKNINVDGAYDCDLLCKLIVDYIPSDSVKIVKESNMDVGTDTIASEALKLRDNIIKDIENKKDKFNIDNAIEEIGKNPLSDSNYDGKHSDRLHFFFYDPLYKEEKQNLGNVIIKNLPNLTHDNIAKHTAGLNWEYLDDNITELKENTKGFNTYEILKNVINSLRSNFIDADNMGDVSNTNNFHVLAHNFSKNIEYFIYTTVLSSDGRVINKTSEYPTSYHIKNSKKVNIDNIDFSKYHYFLLDRNEEDINVYGIARGMKSYYPISQKENMIKIFKHFQKPNNSVSEGDIFETLKTINTVLESFDEKLLLSNTSFYYNDNITYHMRHNYILGVLRGYRCVLYQQLKYVKLFEFDNDPKNESLFTTGGDVKGDEKTTFSAHLEMDAGNFVNYKDTSYEGTKCFFFMPSRHTIDGEQFDLELNIYHGSFDENLGYSSHYHYHHDTDELGVDYHQHIHYHKQGLQGTNDAAHSWGSNKEGLDRDNLNKRKDRKNTVLCLLFNRGDHKGTRINTFFDQFVHSDKFNNANFKVTTNNKYDYTKIRTNKHFSFDDLLPKRRSFFNYETRQVYDDDYFKRFDGGRTKVDSTIYGKEDEFEVVVFDYIQTIDKGIIDIIANKAFAAYENKDSNLNSDKKQGEDFEPILYKKNIEVITDERYKKLVRLQIKDLVSMTRVVQSKPPAHEPKEYYKRADDIYAEQRPGGAFYSYQSDQVNAIGLSNQWEKWGRGDKVLKTAKDILQEAEEQVQIYKDIDPSRYLSAFNTFFSNVEFNTRNRNYLQLFESMYSNVILKVLKQNFDNLGLKQLEGNEKNLGLEYGTPFVNNYLFGDKTYLNQAFHPEVIDMNNIRKNLYLYNKILVLKRIYYVRNDRRYFKFFKDNRKTVQLGTGVKRRSKVMLRDTIRELIVQSFPNNKSVEERIFDSKIYTDSQTSLDIIVAYNGAFIQDKDLDIKKEDSKYRWNNLSMQVEEAFKYAPGANLFKVKMQGANFKLGDINVDMKGFLRNDETGFAKGHKAKIVQVRDVGFEGEDEGAKIKFDNNKITQDPNFKWENEGTYPVTYNARATLVNEVEDAYEQYRKRRRAYHDINNVEDSNKDKLYKMIMAKKNLSAGVLSDPSIEFIYHYEAIDIGQMTSNEMGEGVTDDNVLKIWRYFIQLNENGNYDYTEEFDIYNENFIGRSESLTINSSKELTDKFEEFYNKIKDDVTETETKYDAAKAKNVERKTGEYQTKNILKKMTNREIFGDLIEEKTDEETEQNENDIKHITNKVDSILTVKSSNLIDDYDEFVIKIAKKKSVIMFNILQFLNSGKENEKFKGDGENIFFLTEGPQMKTTIDGDECQKWNSHEVHQEGSLFNIFKSIFKYPENGKIWPWMDQSERLLIQDGLLVARGGSGVKYSATNGVIGSEGNKDEAQIDVTGVASEAVSAEDTENAELMKSEGKTAVTTSSIKWASHNFCRNPGNYMPAPWCYTKNPNVRWQYCIKPDYSQMIARITLLVTFLFIIIIAYLAVRRIFENELFTAFIARLVGGQASQGAGPQASK